jgi:SAM-dependent methyltransferase
MDEALPAGHHMTAMASKAEDVVGLYRRRGLAWASARGERLTEAAWLDRFLGLLPPRPAILDLGCGSGDPIGYYFIDQGCELTGVDTSPDLLALCAAKFPSADWRLADMRALSLGRAFDGILAWDSFFHLDHDDQRAMFPIFRAHAGPGAALMFTTGPAHGVAIGELESEPLFHASLGPDEYRDLLDQHDFDVIAHVVEDPACGRHTIWLAQLR